VAGLPDLCISTRLAYKFPSIRRQPTVPGPPDIPQVDPLLRLRDAFARLHRLAVNYEAELGLPGHEDGKRVGFILVQVLAAKSNLHNVRNSLHIRPFAFSLQANEIMGISWARSILDSVRDEIDRRTGKGEVSDETIDAVRHFTEPDHIKAIEGILRLISGDRMPWKVLQPEGSDPSPPEDQALSAENRALAVLLEHVKKGNPIVMSKIARKAGCSTSYLYRCPRFMAFKAALDGSPSDLPCGQKSTQGGLEAWAEGDDE
jgi:hypothetical protein